MPNNDIRRQIDAVWEEFWQAGLYDPPEIMEQILYLLFLRRLDDGHLRQLAGLAQPRDGTHWNVAGEHERSMRWSGFRHLGAADMFKLLADHVFPRLRRMGGAGSAYAQHMKDARFSIPSAAALAKVVSLLDALPRATAQGVEDPYDYVAGKLARTGRRGEFYTPPHVVRLMVALVAPRPGDIVCSPVSGNGNFLVAAGEYLAQRHPEFLEDPDGSVHFHHRMFHGYDADRSMLRIACMNLALQGIRNPDIRYTNTIAPDVGGGEGQYSVILAHPSTASLPRDGDAAGTAQAEVQMVAQILRLLKPGGRAAVIVPQHILVGASQAQIGLRRILVEDQRMDAVIAFPRGLLNTDPGDAKAILLFTRTDCGGSDHVWFYRVRADGLNANPICVPRVRKTKGKATSTAPAPVREAGNIILPDVLRRWEQRDGAEMKRTRKARSFCVRKEEISGASNSLSVGRYQAALPASS